MKPSKLILLSLCAALLAGCATNPVTGKREIRIFSDKDEVALGAETRDSVIKQYGRRADPALEAYVAGVGQKITAVCDRRALAYSFYVLDTDMVNAFAAPGGYIFVTKGILKAMSDESELAGVLGHEVGHVVGRHSMKAMEKQYGYQALLNIAAMVTRRDLSGMEQYTGYLTNMLLLGYGRDNEFESDMLGTRYALAAGYDPHGNADFFRKLQAMEGGKKANDLEKLFQSHPPTAERIKKVEAQAGQATGARNREAYAAAVKTL
ncbi:MAG TPA: M48 family metallopeptidase [Elusimicrobiales bacterium]|nr:M48 family metallopeptidase [Elusimicrobiales bacterium]